MSCEMILILCLSATPAYQPQTKPLISRRTPCRGQDATGSLPTPQAVPKPAPDLIRRSATSGQATPWSSGGWTGSAAPQTPHRDHHRPQQPTDRLQIDHRIDRHHLIRRETHLPHLRCACRVRAGYHPGKNTGRANSCPGPRKKGWPAKSAHPEKSAAGANALR
jgi:hypothetical protein